MQRRRQPRALTPSFALIGQPVHSRLLLHNLHAISRSGCGARFCIRCLLRKPRTISVGEWLDAEEVVLEKSEARNGSDPRADGPVGYANRFAFDSAPVGSAECRFLVEQVDDGNFPQVEVAFDVLAEAVAAIRSAEQTSE